MSGKLKRKKRHRWQLTVEIVTPDKTYYATEEIREDEDLFGDDDSRDKLFTQAGVPEDMGPDDLLSLTFKVERL